VVVEAARGGAITVGLRLRRWRAFTRDRLAGQRSILPFGVGDDLAQAQRLVEELAPGQARPLPAWVLRRQDVADGEQDLARQLAAAARGPQALQRRPEPFRNPLPGALPPAAG